VKGAQEFGDVPVRMPGLGRWLWWLRDSGNKFKVKDRTV
jgi:hypothetical protein